MAKQGAALQTHNLEMVKCLEELYQNRDMLQRRIAEEEAEQHRVTADLDVLQRRLQQINASLAKKTTMRSQYDKVICQTEEALEQIVRSSQTLVSVTKKNALEIQKLAEHAS